MPAPKEWRTVSVSVEALSLLPPQAVNIADKQLAMTNLLEFFTKHERARPVVSCAVLSVLQHTGTLPASSCSSFLAITGRAWPLRVWRKKRTGAVILAADRHLGGKRLHSLTWHATVARALPHSVASAVCAPCSC